MICQSQGFGCRESRVMTVFGCCDGFVLICLSVWPPARPPAANKNTLEMVQYGVEGSSTFLECQARSPHALIKWHLQRDNSDRRKEVSRGAEPTSSSLPGGEGGGATTRV